MLDFSQLKKLNLTLEKVEPNYEEPKNIKWWMNFVEYYDPDIFSTSNVIFRTNSNSHDIDSEEFVSPESKLFLSQVSKLANQIKIDLEKCIEECEYDETKCKIYHWYDANIYYSSSNIYKVYLEILFEQNNIYRLFGDENKVNVWKFDSNITTDKLIDLLINKENFFQVMTHNVKKLM